MRILTRYMLRAHLGPFIFALSVLTGMLYINTVARRLPELAGKGLPASVFAEVLLLSLPHIVALTLPMAVLVAVLYAYSSLAADNEVTALKASGVNMLRLLVPVLVAAAILTVVMIWFNDRLLPETNHQLKNLMANIAAKSPTLTLREQVTERIPTQDFSSYYIRAGTIDHDNGRLKNVAIYDLSDGLTRRTIYADSGRMGFNQDTTDLFLTLYHGEMYTVNAGQMAGFERVAFVEQRSVLREAGSKWNLDAQDDYRSDRELSLGMLQAQIDSTRTELRSTLRQLRRESEATMDATLAGPAGNELPATVPATAGSSLMPQYYTNQMSLSDQVIGRAVGEIGALANRAEDLERRIRRNQVEYHKKFAIPFACIIFVLIGAPLAVRFPRGGAGMVIAISLAIFGVYYMSLIGGESLGDDGVIEPFIGPWAPNIAFGILAIWGVTRIGRETSTTRGGDWEDLWRTTLQTVSAPWRRRARRRAKAAAAAGGAD